MHVEAPVPLVDHRFYAVAVAYAVQGALQRDSALRHVNYNTYVDVWLSPSGEILHLQFVSGSGDEYAAIAEHLQSLVIGLAPPGDLHQPVRIKIRSTGAG